MGSKESSHQWRLFFRQFVDDFNHMGAILPSSRALTQAGVAYLAQKQGAGTGTGSRGWYRGFHPRYCFTVRAWRLF